ncbi:MAG: methyltransferase domain-containing protein [Caldilineaceae bacterium]|nr:methyltransferase domain-containing protein [Caldilineaceae bacterium]
MEQIHTAVCTVCQSPRAAVFMEAPRAPVICNVLWPTRAAALAAPRADIRLAFCPHCGHIFNPDFDPAIMDYNVAYENSLHFSPRFQQYVEALAADLVQRYNLRQKDVIDIGGGKGDFLKLICDLGDNRGLSIDPSYAPGPQDGPIDPRITFVQDYYSEAYADRRADFIASRHTIEHIQNPVAFMQTLRRTIGDRSEIVLFFEAPNARFTLHDLAIWDIIYEHCSYFTAHSLGFLFTRCGFSVLDIRESFGGQFLCIEARPAQQTKPTRDAQAVDAIAHDVAVFAERHAQKVAQEAATLAEWRRDGKKVVVWGAGSKGITYLNSLNTQDQIAYVVDVNPRKHGMFITGAGQEIVPPARLREYQPDVVLVMNPIYLDEIRQMLAAIEVTAELVPAL